MDWERLFFSRLVIAVPDIAFDDEIMRYLVRKGYLTRQEIDNLNFWKGQVRRVNRTAGRLSGRTFAQRLMVIAPELISIRTVNLLRRLNVIDDPDGHRLRLFVRTLGVAGVIPSNLPSNATLRARLAGLTDTFVSQEMVDLYRLIPVPSLGRELTVEEANFLRGTLIGKDRLEKAVDALKGGEGLLDRIFLVAAELLDEKVIRAGVLTGAISPRNGRILFTALRLGRVAWRTSTRVWNAAGWEQRALLASTGMFSTEMITFLRTLRIIDAGTARTLRVMSNMAGSIARMRLDMITAIDRTYRVLPGESPIATFARVSRYTDADIIGLLDEAARETKKKIEALAPKEKIGARTRRAQERILLNSLFNEMRALWEGVGYLTIMGERSAAAAAVDSMDFLTRNLWRQTGKEGDLIRRQLREQGRAGVDSLISREENMRALSRRVYKNLQFAQAQVGRRIQINLIRGVSAKEFAEDIARMIRPTVRGGVSYAAQRLARTEINNAFFQTGIRYTREMPWVNGYQWNLSATHRSRQPVPDVCDDYAHDDGYGMGPGRFPKSSVPGKPHPLCLCFLTNVVVEQEQFLQNYRRGTYNSFFAARRAAGAYADAPDPLLQAYNRRMWGDMATGAARGAGMGAARFAGALVLTKLEESFFGGG